MINSFRKYSELLGLLPCIKFFIFKHLVRKKELKVLIKGKKHPIYLRNFTSDITVFNQLFINEEYRAGITGLHPKTIVDCGANIGLATVYFKFFFPDAKIYSFEPELSNYNLLQKNILGFRNIETYRKAIWNESLSLNLIRHSSHDSFSVKENNDSHDKIEEVEAVSINDFCNEKGIEGIDLLKIDIEGAEVPLFSRNLSWLTKTETIIVEIHERFKPGATQFINNLLVKNFAVSHTGEYVKYSRKI